MKLAKAHLDVGLMTNELESMLAFWQQDVGLPRSSATPTATGSRSRSAPR
jgi:lactoylglutathione lyase